VQGLPEMPILNGFRPRSVQNSSLTRWMLPASPFLHHHWKPPSSPAPSSPPSPSASSPAPSTSGTNILEGRALMLSMTNFFQSKCKLSWVCLGCTGVYSIGMSIDSTRPVPIPSEMAWMSFFYVGRFVLSIPKIYLVSGGASNSFLTMRARSFTWMVGTKFLPSPTMGSFSGSYFHARSKWWLKMASPRP